MRKKCLGSFSVYPELGKKLRYFKNYLFFALEFIHISICYESWLPNFLANRISVCSAFI